MSQFIESYFKIMSPKKTKMKFYFNSHRNQWSIHIIPVIDLYLESHSPIQHKRFMKDGATGLFLSISWLDRGYTFGLSRTLK